MLVYTYICVVCNNQPCKCTDYILMNIISCKKHFLTYEDSSLNYALVVEFIY